MIVFTEGWCLMDDTRAVLVGHVGVHNYAESPILILRKGSVRLEGNHPPRTRLIGHLLGEILEHWRVSPASHVLASELTNFLELDLFRVFVQGHQARFKKNVIHAAFLVVYFDVIQVWMDTERKIRWKRPGRSRPGQKRRLWIVDERERDGH